MLRERNGRGVGALSVELVFSRLGEQPACARLDFCRGDTGRVQLALEVSQSRAVSRMIRQSRLHAFQPSQRAVPTVARRVRRFA
jgi:hypothetical protein